jgi:RNA polymerase sigma-70 factor (ECF subfamily)
MEKERFITEVLSYRRRLENYARRFIKEDDTEDIIQEVLLKLWLMRETLDGYDSIYALSIRITKHLCINKLRADKHNVKMADSIIMESESLTPDMQLVQKDDMEHLIRIIDQLPESQQIILRMKHIDGLEVEEIAEITGCKPGTIYMSLSRARKRVKELFFKKQGL